MAGKPNANKGKGKAASSKSSSSAVLSSADDSVDIQKGQADVEAAVTQLENSSSGHNCDGTSLEDKKLSTDRDCNNILETTVQEESATKMEAVSHLEGTGEQGIDLVTVKGSSGEPKGTEEQHLYPMTVRGPSGEQIELQVSPTDSVMDLRQFLLDAPETCFYTCYDLILHGADGTKYQLAEYLEIGEVANISVEGCSLEMVNAPYDDRSIRSHVRRTRDLISTASIYSSLSTVLALDYEKKQANSGSSEGSDAASSKSKPLAGKEEGTAKTEAPELEGLGFMEDQAGMLGDLVSGPVVEEVKCVKSISFSSFNPVPGYRRLRGDLIYIDIVSLENKSYCVTAHTQGFYVNSSSGEILDPTAVIPALEGTTLIGLLHKISPLFTKGFSEVLERKAAGHPFELVPVVLPPNAWLGHYPPQPHRRDIGRAEEALVAPYGTETIGMQRDWNEELQSCKEFPRETSQDRIMRDRALYKVNCDFVDAAIKGAKAVIGRCIPPINPTDPERFHMYVHNNIFFSFAVDGDFMLMQQSKGQESLENPEGNLKTKEPTSINEETEHSTEPSAALSSTPDLKLEDNSVQPIDGEQATYASANNDLKGTKAYNSADVAGLYTLAMAIVDFRGHRVVAQSIIPGILQGDKTETLLYGSIDNGKKISWNEKFHVKVVEAGKDIHIKEHEVLDGSGARIKICAPVECKGIVGSDNRYYILDLMRTTPRDVNYTGLGSRLCVLRPELVAAFCQIESSERSKLTKGEDVDTENGTVSPKKNLSPILLNPNVFTDFNVTGDPEEVSADEALVRKAGNYLVDTVLPKFVQDLSSLEVSPMDGQTLTEALHAHGINVRYLGKVAVLAKQLPHIWTLCVVEMVVRSAKHVLKGVLRETLDQDVGGAIAHFLNCFLGLEDASSFQLLPNAKLAECDVVSPGKQLKNNGNGSSKRKKKDKGHGGRSNVSSSKIDSSDTDIQKDNVLSIVEGHSRKQPLYMCITSELVWIDIQENVKFKYQFELPDDAKAKAHNISTIRNLCLKVGITLAARHYVFDSPNPFRTEDILDLQAVVKHTAPVCSDAHNLLENGKLRLAQGKLNEAYEMFSEAFGILQQVCGPMHREVSNCCRYLAMVLYHAGDLAGAIMQQHKELIINERCLGPDHPDTAHSYGNMALFYHGLNQSELALRHMARTLLLLSVSCGSDHPDVAATFINVAVMYQEIGRMHVALRYLQEALKRNERLLGPDHIQTAICYHALAIAFNCMKAFKLSIQHERSTYNILLKQLGEEDSRTRESANWIKTFQIREMQASAEKQKGQQQAVQKAAEVIKAFQAASAGSMRGSIPKIADAIPRSRGMDERGARAAAEVRKKAAAKGLNVRSLVEQNGPVTELLGLSNNFDPSGKIPLNASVPRVNKAGGKPNLTKSDSQLSKETKEAALTDEDPVKTSEMAENKAPLGLGAGLGMLEAKKQKSKQK